MSQHYQFIKFIILSLLLGGFTVPVFCQGTASPLTSPVTRAPVATTTTPSPATTASPATIAARAKQREQEESILNQILGGKYDVDIRPTGGNTTKGETQVEVNLALNAVSKIDDFSMEYSVQVTLRMEWYDDNLKFAHLDPSKTIKYLTLSDMKRVWIPDLFFVNEKQSRFHNIIKPNVYIRIYPTGLLSTSVRISLTLDCPMDLRLFPMDTQVCGIVMSSYAWTNDDVDFRWRQDNPVQLPSDMSLPRFTMKKHETKPCLDKTDSGDYSCVQVEFVLIRNFSYYLTSSYIPCMLLVFVSWVSFWIDENAVPARIALGVTTLLTMATQQANMNKNLPPVSYTKALDVWSETCLIFIFGALVEFAFVNYALRYDKRMKLRIHTNIGNDPVPSSWLIRRYPSTSKKIDLISRLLFPFVFLVFNIYYWAKYL